MKGLLQDAIPISDFRCKHKCHIYAFVRWSRRKRLHIYKMHTQKKKKSNNLYYVPHKYLKTIKKGHMKPPAWVEIRVGMQGVWSLYLGRHAGHTFVMRGYLPLSFLYLGTLLFSLAYVHSIAVYWLGIGLAFYICFLTHMPSWCSVHVVSYCSCINLWCVCDRCRTLNNPFFASTLMVFIFYLFQAHSLYCYYQIYICH